MVGGLNSVRELGVGHRTRFIRFGVCVLSVAALHLLIGRSVAQHMAEFGEVTSMPPRLEVAYVRDMEVSAPPAAAALPSVLAAAPRAAKRAPVVSAAASQPRPQPELPPELPPKLSPPRPTPEPEPVRQPDSATAEVTPSLAEPAASVAPEPILPPPLDTAPTAANFVWPGATRLSYVLTGNYRGEINGKAQVEWLRAGNKYQVHLDVLVGVPMAPLITRRMSSEGQITPEGLVPERFDEDTKVMFRDRRRLKVSFEADTVVLANGARQPRPAGVQDSASQFVQLSYLFSLKPELLAVGGAVTVPLALSRKIDTWTYDVVAAEPLFTPFGEVASYHLKPRRAGQATGQVSSDLTAEIWIAPSLQYLPARIRIRQDADTFIDMLIERKPQLAAAN